MAEGLVKGGMQAHAMALLGVATGIVIGYVIWSFISPSIMSVASGFQTGAKAA